LFVLTVRPILVIQTSLVAFLFLAFCTGKIPARTGWYYWCSITHANWRSHW